MINSNIQHIGGNIIIDSGSSSPQTLPGCMLARIKDTYNIIQVVPGRAGGGSFKRKKNYIAKKEFAYRMCAR